MSGHNHFRDCTCGWCVHYTRYRGAITNPLETYRHQSALRLLRTSGADRSRAACFVNPNAICPECGAVVYYYENASGSRVFFDDLGPPWPKHPCTDYVTGNLGNWVKQTSIIRRKRGEAASIEQAIINTRFDWPEMYKRAYNSVPRELYQVDSVLFVGFANLMMMYRLDTTSEAPKETRVRFLKYTSQKTRPQINDIVAVGNGKVWVLDRSSWRSRNFDASPLTAAEFDEAKHS